MAGSTLIVAGLRQRLIYTCVRGLQSTHIDGAEEEIVCTRNLRLWGSNLLLLDQDIPKEDFFHLDLSLPGDLNFVVEWQQQYYLVSSCRPPWLLTYDKVAYNTTKFKTISREELLLNSPQSSAKAHPYCREASFDSLHSVFWSTNALQI